jgi:hypothetical protein
MMSLYRLATQLIAALLGAAVCSANAAEWKRLESTHYVTYANIREEAARSFVQHLELMHWLTLRLVGGGTAPASTLQGQRAEVFLTGREPDASDDYVQGQLTLGGEPDCVQVQGLNHTWVPDTSISGPDGRLDVVAELAATQIMIRQAPMAFPQLWYARGFARYIAASELKDGQLYLGGIHADSSAALRNVWLPYETVLRLQSGEDSKTGFNGQKFAAQSWWLVRQLLSSAAGKQQLADYLARVAQDEEPVAAFEAATGRKIAEWERSLFKESQGRFQLQRVRAELLPHIDIRVTPVEPQAERYLHLRYRLRCTDGLAAAETQALRQRLHQAVADAGPPGTELALDLARADLRADDLVATQARLEALVQTTPESGEGRLLLAQTLRRQAQNKDKPLDAEAQRAALERAAEHLVQAQRLLPDSARARYEQAQVLMALGRPTEALVAARAARQRQPSNWAYSLIESKLALQVGNRQVAVDALELFAYQTWWPDHAKTARTLIAAAVAGKPATDLLNLLKADEPAANTNAPKP